jgi:hypothetical protein
MSTIRTDRYIRNYISRNFHPDYPLLSIGGSPKGKFFRVYIEVAPQYPFLVMVPTPASKQRRRK